MVFLKHARYFVLVAHLIDLCTATFLWKHGPVIHAGTRVYTPPVKYFNSRRLPPTIIHTRLIVPYLPIAPLTPRAESVYPATGHNNPNPLDNLNTFDLPQWNPVYPQWGPQQPQWNPIQPQWNQPTEGPVFVRSGINVDNIVPQAPTGTVFISDSVAVPIFPRDTRNNQPTVQVPFPDSPVVVPADVLPPVVVPADPQTPVHVPTDSLPPVMVPTDPRPPVLIPEETGSFPPVVVPDDVLPPVMVPRDDKKSCLQTGCELGSECSFQGAFICPPHIKDAKCQCLKGCRVQYTFIPLGGTAIVDPCGNVCTCNSLFGTANCTKNKCDNKNKVPNDGLLIEPVPSGPADQTGPLRGDFPPGLTFPSQNFVPFLTTNTFPSVNGVQGIANQPVESQNLKFNNGNVQTSDLQDDAMVFPLSG